MIGSPGKVNGIGTVQIRMHDETIKTLSDVRHVPDLKKNFSYLGILDSKGCRIYIESNIINVSRGVLFLMKGKNIGSLYALEGSMMTNEIGCPSSVKESKSTRLKLRALHSWKSDSGQF
ncbi:hypothetical protein PVK06_034551 [Gossypium arboreum]|uniref:Retrovirus-related Pol polyprotein from transposon TNT 1-94-like beta-barrel domain-containing protein n=1 Tax=Gossypium arboreum TaxID=29729 RepID=A0ABR0NEG7_GOSAR|nr:hypothetical protein PVK06_034551 [Gossypium arboreum]